MSVTSLFAKFENAEKSTCAFFEQKYAELHADLPKITAVADKILPYASMLIQIVVGAECGSATASAVGAGLAKAQSALDVANAVVYDTGVTPTAVSAINAVATNLNGIAASTDIKNPQSVVTLNKAVSELTLLTAAMTATPTAPVA